MRFVHETRPQRVCFGSGEAAAAVTRELAALGASRVMVIAARGRTGLAARVTASLSMPVVLRYGDVVMHVPVEVAERARRAAARVRADALVSVGGGSTTGLAKAIALTTGLPEVAARPGDLEGRERVLYAAYLSAVAFASAGSGLHHSICHVLGGAYNLPHAQTHAVVLPYVLAFNGAAAPEAEQRIARAFGAGRAIDGLENLRRALPAPRALRDYGFAERAIPAAAEAIVPAVPPGNPRPVTAAALRRLLRAAWAGADPRALADEDGE